MLQMSQDGGSDSGAKQQNQKRYNVNTKGAKGERTIMLGKVPLAEQMRPRTLDDYLGQVATSTQTLLRELFHNDRIPSMIMWGPPGCGKVSTILLGIPYRLRYNFLSTHYKLM